MHNLTRWNDKRKRGKGKPSRLTDDDMQWIIAARREGVKWEVIERKYGYGPTSARNISDSILHRTGVELRNPQHSKRVQIAPVTVMVPTIAETPTVKSAFEECDARALKRRGFSVMQIAALLRKPYREVLNALEAR